MESSEKWTIKINAVADIDTITKEEDVIVEDIIFQSLKDQGREYLETSLLACFVADMQNDKHTMKGWFGKEAFAKTRDKVVHPLPLIPKNLNELINRRNSTDEKYIYQSLACPANK